MTGLTDVAIDKNEGHVKQIQTLKDFVADIKEIRETVNLKSVANDERIAKSKDVQLNDAVEGGDKPPKKTVGLKNFAKEKNLPRSLKDIANTEIASTLTLADIAKNVEPTNESQSTLM